MKKLKLLIIFWLGILIGIFFRQLKLQVSQISRPIVQSGKLDLDQLISSITDTIDTQNLNLTPTGRGQYERFETVYDILQDNYYDTAKLNSGAMIEKAVKAFVDAIDDPYTVYMDSDQNSGFQEELKWEADFEGIGAVVTKKDYYVMIEEIIKDSPAFKAGLIPLDRVIMIDTGSTKDLTVDQAVSQIRGPKGTQVILTIERISKDDERKVLEIPVTRDQLLIPSVTSKIFTGWDDTAIWYINISIIGEETEKLFQKEIKTLAKQNVKWIILDLRGNGWGLLPIAVEICSHFVPKNKVVVTARYKIFEEEVYKSEGYKDLQGLPVVVLVDDFTASAWEIIALALQEQIWAQIIGTQTFGKGSIQTMDEFDDHASLKYTIGKRYSPENKNIDKIWITPDILIPFDTWAYANDRTDNQLLRAQEELIKILQQ